MIVLICVCYYCLAIIGCLFRYYFSKFIASDYIHNKSLNRKRIGAIFYNYFVVVYSSFILVIGGEANLNIIIFWSAVLIIIIYVFLIDFLETPPRYKKRKKWE